MRVSLISTIRLLCDLLFGHLLRFFPLVRRLMETRRTDNTLLVEAVDTLLRSPEADAVLREGCLSAEPAVAEQHVKRWQSTFNKSFTAPTAEQKQRILAAGFQDVAAYWAGFRDEWSSGWPA